MVWAAYLINIKFDRNRTTIRTFADNGRVQSSIAQLVRSIRVIVQKLHKGVKRPFWFVRLFAAVVTLQHLITFDAKFIAQNLPLCIHQCFWIFQQIGNFLFGLAALNAIPIVQMLRVPQTWMPFVQLNHSNFRFGCKTYAFLFGFRTIHLSFEGLRIIVTIAVHFSIFFSRRLFTSNHVSHANGCKKCALIRFSQRKYSVTYCSRRRQHKLLRFTVFKKSLLNQKETQRGVKETKAHRI